MRAPDFARSRKLPQSCWVPSGTASRVVDCRPPYSFYVDLIKPHWHAEKADYHPLHRLATLARKQGAQSIVIESALDRPEVIDEITDLDKAYGGGGVAEAIAFTFFAEALSAERAQALDPQTLIGQCVLISYRPPQAAAFEHTYIYEAVFATPSMRGGTRLLNNFIYTDAEFTVRVHDQTLPLTGVYYCQQNGCTSVCAHASIRMVVNSMRPGKARLTNRAINDALGGVPSDGLVPSQIKTIIESAGDLSVDIVNCQNIKAVDYISILTAAAESGDIALLTFTTGAKGSRQTGVLSGAEVPEAPDDEAGADTHVVVVVGHTLNSDEWHPQALPAYSGLPGSRYSPSSDWVDHFVIHDDNFGPYFTLSSRALELDPSVKASRIIIIRDRPCHSKAFAAEAAASVVLSKLLPPLVGLASNSWFDRITTSEQDYVTRPVLVTRERYMAHIEAAVGHDGSRTTADERAVLATLPEHFWMVEFTIADLFTGNKSKLGEVLFQPNWDRCDVSQLCALRLPGLFCLHASDPEGRQVAEPHSWSLTSHVGIYRTRNHDHEW